MGDANLTESERRLKLAWDHLEVAHRELNEAEAVAKGRRKRVAKKARIATRRIMKEITMEFFDSGS